MRQEGDCPMYKKQLHRRDLHPISEDSLGTHESWLNHDMQPEVLWIPEAAPGPLLGRACLCSGPPSHGCQELPGLFGVSRSLLC